MNKTTNNPYISTSLKNDIPAILIQNEPLKLDLEQNLTNPNFTVSSQRKLLLNEETKQQLLEPPKEIIEEHFSNEQKSSIDKIYSLPLVKKAIQQFKVGLIYSNASPLDEKNAEYINDQSYAPKPQVKFPKIKNPIIRKLALASSFVINKINSLPVFGPYDTFRLFWDFLNFIAIVFLIFWIPIEIGFSTFLPSEWGTFFLLIFAIDLILNMNTAFHMNGYLINDRMTIYSNYLQNYMIFDFLSFVVFFLKHRSSSANYEDIKNDSSFYFQWVFFLRIRNLKVIYGRFLERIYSKFNIRDSYIDLVNLLFTSIFILHIFACFWHFLAQYNGFSESEITWVTTLGIEKKSISIRYMYSFYWSSVTVMTVGYGDISPVNNSEIIFTIIAVCVGCGVTAYVISSIGTIVSEFNKESQIYK